MPKNGFFFLFMAPVTPKAKNVKDPGRGPEANHHRIFKFRRRKQLPPALPLPGSRTPRVRRSPRPPWDSRAEVHETRLPAASAKGGDAERVRGNAGLLAPRANRVLLGQPCEISETEQGRPCLQPVLDAFLRPSCTISDLSSLY